MIYFSRKSNNFQDVIKFWGFVGTKKYGKICIFSMKWNEQESVWPKKSVILVIFFENSARDRILLESLIFHENWKFFSKYH